LGLLIDYGEGGIRERRNQDQELGIRNQEPGMRKEEGGISGRLINY
jgi:hypothetical protein